MKRPLSFSLAVLLLCTVGLRAQPLTPAFTYEGELRAAGVPATGPHDLRFRLYDAPTDGVQVGPTLCVEDLNVAGGRFAVLLDFGPQFAGQQRFLEIEVRPGAEGDCANAAGFTMLSPRQAVTATPHALFALNATTATDAARLNGEEASFYRNAANLSTGTLSDQRLSSNVVLLDGGQTFYSPVYFATAPRFISFGPPFEVGSFMRVQNLNADMLDSLDSSELGRLTAAQTWTGANTFSSAANIFTGSGAGLTGLNASNLAGGRLPPECFYGTYLSTLSFPNATNSFSGSGAGLTNLSAWNITDGTLAEARLPASVALLSSSQTFTATKSFSVAPSFIAPTGAPFGVTSTTRIPNLNADLLDGLHATSFLQAIPNPLILTNSQSAAAVISGTNSSSGNSSAGVYGLASAASGVTYGVYGRSQSSSSGYGVFGYATATTGLTNGGRFFSDSTSGRGVFAGATALTGITYGVVGECQSTHASAYGVFAMGRLGATGTKPFRIDHPVDPENKYLLHYACESPEVVNMYSGTVTLDNAGGATVELPAYFASINKEPRYTLTAVGAPMPMLHVAEEISEDALAAGERSGPGVAPPTCSFRIAGGVAGAKVSWEVKAVRNDLWMRMRGAPVEILKEGLERGTYQHPEFYSQPRERGVNSVASDR